MYLRAIAIDDEAPALEVIAAHAARVPFIQLLKTFISPVEALTYMQRQPVELAFVDIQMPDLLGIELARLAQSTGAQFIFTTAYAEFAVEAFRLEALDYLLKPVEFPRFLEACQRASRQQFRPRSDDIFVKDGYDWVRVHIPDILFIRSDTNLLFIHHAEGVTITRMTMPQLLDMLPAANFLRVHKSYAVALKAIRKIERHQITVGNTVIPVARSCREGLENALLKRD